MSDKQEIICYFLLIICVFMAIFIGKWSDK